MRALPSFFATVGFFASLFFADAAAGEHAVTYPASGGAELFVLERNGDLDFVAPGGVRLLHHFAAPRALASWAGGHAAVLADGKIQILDGKSWRALPGRFDDAFELAACGKFLFVATNEELVTVDRDSGARREHRPHGQKTAPKIFCGGETLFVERAGVVEPQPSGAAWTIPGRRPRALAADGPTLYAATRDGPLWQFTDGHARDLGMGGWWGTLALAAADGKLYAVTQAGKLWLLDPATSTKTILSMDGWEAALALAVSR